MEKKAKDFLNISGELYITNKKKWKQSLKKLDLEFDEDIYNDTIIKVYENILEGEDTEGDVIGYWFQSFINNLRRDKHYSVNSKKEDVDVIDLLENEEYIPYNDNSSSIKEILHKVKLNNDIQTYHLFKIYYLTDITFEDLNKIAGYDCKSKILKIKKWITTNNNIL